MFATIVCPGFHFSLAWTIRRPPILLRKTEEYWLAVEGIDVPWMDRKKATSLAAEASRAVAYRGRNSVGFRHKAHPSPIYMMMR